MTTEPTHSGGRGWPPRGTVYLLHFDERYEHAGHYTGWATDLDTRLAAHVAGKGPLQGGARLIQVIRQAGIGFRLARTWPDVTRARERQLKRQGGASRHCPLCQEQRRAQRTAARHAGGQRQAGRQPPEPTPPPLRATPARPRRGDAVAVFLTLNPAFARPASASRAKQWGRVRGREDIELHGPRVTAARFDENQQFSQQRAAAVTRRAIAARAQARQQRTTEHAARQARRGLPEHTRRQLQVARTRQHHQPRAHATGRRARREETDRER